MVAPIQLSILLNNSSRDHDAIAQLVNIIAQLGLQPTLSGTATVSCRATPEVFLRLFGRDVTESPALPAAGSDYGTPAGYRADDLPVPPVMSPYVDSISVVPPATRLRNQLD